MQPNLGLVKRYVYGPVSSRRLGRSLGVNISPTEVKHCSFGCIYCERGLTTVFYGSPQDKPEYMPPAGDILAEIEASGEPEVEETFAHPETGNPVQVSSEWHCTEQEMQLLWHYDQLLPGGAVERFTASAVHQILPLETYLTEFQAAGLPVVKRYGDFNRRAYKPASPYLILVAQAHD